MIRLEVPLGSRSYPVVVGASAICEFESLVPDGVSRIAFVTQPGINVSLETELPSRVHMLPDGEAAKKLSVVEELCSDAWCQDQLHEVTRLFWIIMHKG